MNNKHCSVGQHRTYTFTEADIGKARSLLQHNCKCGSCCRRVALFADAVSAEDADEWLVKVIARVTFGSNEWCYGSFVEVDWKRGVILDLLGDFVSVEIEPIEIVGAPPELGFGAVSACCGAGGARGCATRTFSRQNAEASGGTVSFPIPPFAYAVMFAVASGDFFAATTELAQLGSGLSQVVAATTGDEVPEQWAIAGGANRIVIVNGDGAADLNFEPVFLIGV